jgi:hypothetical protein
MSEALKRWKFSALVDRNIPSPPQTSRSALVFGDALRVARPARILGLFATVLLSVASASACSVPVFRYALEKWPADAYPATVFHRGPLTAAQQALVRELSRDGLAGRLHANVSVEMVDLAQNPPPEALERWRALGQINLPWLTLAYPKAAKLPDLVTSAPLSEAAIRTVLDSPVRQEIVRRLGHGDSAVWVLLEIGDPVRDDATAKLVESRLNYLAGVLKLPALDPQDVANGLVNVPAGGLKLAFSVVRVSRANPAETAFVRMLLGSEGDLHAIAEPMLFPVFGRGRALYALAGNGISHETLDEAASFLIGRCSCQVKEQNPGVDLLLAANWETLLQTQGRSEPAPQPVEAAPETVTISGGASATAPAATSPAAPLPVIRWLAAAFALGGLVVAMLWWRGK